MFLALGQKGFAFQWNEIRSKIQISNVSTENSNNLNGISYSNFWMSESEKHVLP